MGGRCRPAPARGRVGTLEEIRGDRATSLRHAILGFLSSTPGTGYEIGREFSQAAGSFWSALPSQIYPELQALEKLGWIAGTIADGDRLRRRVFRLTEAGAEELQLWVEADNDYPPERDAERVRLIFLDRSSAATIRRHLLHHREIHQARAERWRQLRDATARQDLHQIAARLASRPEPEHDLIMLLKLLALDGNIARAKLEIDWANAGLRSLEELDARTGRVPEANERV